jgi:hypothetical protein
LAANLKHENKEIIMATFKSKLFLDPSDWLMVLIDLAILAILAIALWQGWLHFSFPFYL